MQPSRATVTLISALAPRHDHSDDRTPKTEADRQCGEYPTRTACRVAGTALPSIKSFGRMRDADVEVVTMPHGFPPLPRSA